MAEAHVRKLTSWKEIASYLARDVRTVQRWEKEFGLPVHRVAGMRSHSVYASTDEIDTWVAGGGVPHVDAVAGQSAHRGARLRVTGLGLSLMLVVAFGLLWLTRRGSASVRFTLEESRVVAWNGEGKSSWSYDFGQPTWTTSSEEKLQRIQVLDAPRADQKEVMVMAPLCMQLKGDLSTDTLYSFSVRGKLLWSHRFDEKIRFGGREYGPQWLFGAMMTSSDGHARSVWCAVNEFPLWPSQLLQFDVNGKPLSRFVNSGRIMSLNHFRNRDGSFILAGGINNE